MIYPRETLDTIKTTINILDLAHKLNINVTQIGSDKYQAKCKHIGDDTPSLTFFTDTNTFHCFGCAANGDIIKFVSWYLDLSFPDAVKKIIELYNLQVEVIETKQRDFFPQLSKLLVKNRDYWRELSGNQKIIDYLLSRNINEEDTKKWRIGLTPNTNNQYANKLVFAIMDEHDQTVGFSYRSMNGAKPKYINSPDSEIFKKSHILYGLNYAKELITEKKYIVLVEGFTDTIQLQKYGVPAVGLMGTALSKFQTDIIKRFTNDVIVCLDNDVAGLSAMERIIPILRSSDLSARMVVIEGVDPDQLAIELREDIVQYIEDNAVLLESYKIQKAIAFHKMQLDEINIKFLNKVFPLLSSISNTIDLEYQIAVVSSTCNIDKEFIYRMLTKGGYYGRNK